MTSDTYPVEILEFLERHQARYEVRPYYVLVDQRPVGSPPGQQRIQAGFEVDLYGAVEKAQWPPTGRDEAPRIVEYFTTMTKEIQTRVGQHCSVEIIRSPATLCLDTREHFQPQAMLRILITHTRGLDQPSGPVEERVLNAIREMLGQLGLKQT